MREFVKQIFIMRECVNVKMIAASKIVSLGTSKKSVSGTRPDKCLQYSEIPSTTALPTRSYMQNIVMIEDLLVEKILLKIKEIA